MSEKKIKVAFIQRNPDCGLGAMYIASAIKPDADCRVFIKVYEEDFYSAVEMFAPDIVAFSTFTGEHNELLAINKEIKRRMDVLSIFGGPHPTYNPEFINENGVDVVCRGEGEYAMLELVKAVRNDEDYSGIENLYFKTSHGQIVKNEVRPLVEDLDGLNYPDRTIYSHYFNIKGFKDNIVKKIITGRGCPYNCSYCYNHILKKIYCNKGRFVRVRSVDNVIGELISLKQEFQACDFNFVDDLFGMNMDWFKRFSAKYKEEIKVPFMCLAHLNLLTEDYVYWLKEAGCSLLCLGVECGDELYRKKVLNRNYANDDILEVAGRLHKYAMPFFTFNIILLPGETLKMALKTLQLNMKCRPFTADAFIFQPYPGTDLANYAANNHYYEGDSMMIPKDLFTGSVLKNPEKSRLLRLFYLFSFTVRFRAFYPLARLLIYLPFDRLYKKLHDYYKNEARKYYMHGLGSRAPRVCFWNLLLSVIKLNKTIDFLDHRYEKVRSTN